MPTLNIPKPPPLITKKKDEIDGINFDPQPNLAE